MVDVILVDKYNNEIGVKDKLQAHIDGDLHRAFSVLIFSTNFKKMLIHQRNKDKYHCGGLWTNACCSHPLPKELISNAVKRRVNEELGYSNLIFIEKFNFIYKSQFENGLFENEFDYVYFSTTNSDPPNIDPNEIQDWKWIEIKNLYEDVNLNPDKYTFWFKEILNKIKVKNLIQF